MIEVTKKQWDKIPDDYKGKWTHADIVFHAGKIPSDWEGRRNVFEGCILPGHGAVLITEGVHFQITA